MKGIYKTRTLQSILMLGILFLGFIQALNAQEVENIWAKTIKDFQVKPILAFQFWGSYTAGMEQYQEEKGDYVAIDNRLNFMVRRTRFGFQAQPYEFLSIKVVAAIDLVGRDLNSAFNGGANNGSFPNFGLWDAYLQFRLKKNSEAIYLKAGYFVPAFGLSSLNSAFHVNSISKSFSQAYIRQHLVGRNFHQYRPLLVIGFRREVPQSF